jgi:hypothetical protein
MNTIAIPSVLTIHAIASAKSGKVSKNADKAATLLRTASSATVLAVAMSKGALQTTAQSALRDLTPTMGAILSGDTVANWGDLLTMLANRFGLRNLNRDKLSTHYMKGRKGVIAYVQLCLTDAYGDEKRAEGDKAAEKADALITELLQVVENVNRLSDAHESARLKAETDAALLASGLAPDATAPDATAPAPDATQAA